MEINSDKNYKSLFTLASIIAVIIICFFLYPPANPLSWDVFGYYLYLPLAFIHKDIFLHHPEIVSKIVEQYHNTDTIYQAYQTETGGWVLKYPMGLAVLYSPFFLLGHIWALLRGYPADGFSHPYQISILIGSAVYRVIGLYYLRKIALKYFDDIVTAIVLIIVFFGTNYLFQTSIGDTGLMSHNYLFTLYALLIRATIKWHESFKRKYLILIVFICALSALARPSEIVSFLIPAFWNVFDKDSFKKKINFFKENKFDLLLVIILSLVVAAPQFIYWKIATKSFFYNSYNNPGEGFEFLHPFIRETLFSFRKGWFIYTPVMIFSVIGFVFLYKQNAKIFYALLIYFLLNLYIVSSWSCWWYAACFSQRALIPSYVVLAFPLGAFVQYIKTKGTYLKLISVLLGLGLISLNLFQSWQSLHSILDMSRMTKAYYFSILGQTTPVTNAQKGLLLVDRSTGNEEQISNPLSYVKTKIWEVTFENNEGNNAFISNFIDGNSKCMKIDSANLYSYNISIPFNKITRKDHAWIKASMDVFPTTDCKTNPGCLVVSFDHHTYTYKFKAECLDNLNLEIGKWNHISTFYLTPEVRNLNDELKVYYMHMGRKTLYIDNLKAEIFEQKD